MYPKILKLLIIPILISSFGLFDLNAEELIFTSIDVSQGLSDNQIRSISQLPDGRMVFTTNGNVNLYDGANFRYIHRAHLDEFSLTNYEGYYRVYQSTDSLLWIKDKHKLMCIDLHLEEYIQNLNTIFKKKNISHQIEDFFVDSNQRIWLLTKKGLIQPESSKTIKLFSNNGKLQDIASENEKLFLFYNNGVVDCYDISTEKKLYSCATYPQSEIINFDRTTSVIKGAHGFYQIRNGKKGGLFFFNTQRKTWEIIMVQDYKLNTMIITPQEKVYICCSKGLWIIDMKNGEKQHLSSFRNTEGELISTHITTIFLDKQQGLWIGTFNRGLMYQHPARYKFDYIRSSSFPDSTSEDIPVQAFVEDDIGNIFIRSRTSFYLYTPNSTGDKILKKVSANNIDKKALDNLYREGRGYIYNNKINTTIFKDSRGWTWTGTPDGLELSTPDSTNNRVFYIKNGMSNSYIHAILEDKKHNLWVTTSYGITKIEIDKVTKKIIFSKYNVYDGTLKGEYINGSIYEAKDDRLYFGGVDGFNVLIPEKLNTSVHSLKPVFTHLYLRGEEVAPNKYYDHRLILTKVAPYTSKITLSYNQNFLTFVFSALNYVNPAQTRYRYKMEGIDNAWNESVVYGNGDKTWSDGILRIHYTNLPAGKYNLSVMSSTDENWEKNEVTNLEIIVNVPWWKSTIAYILYLLSVILIVGGGIYAYIQITKNKLERDHKEEILLLRIRNLIEQNNNYEHKQKSNIEDNSIDNLEKPTSLNVMNTSSYSIEESDFLSKAIAIVEENIDNPTFSVSQLSQDLFMERTGLYKKLIGILDKSPSLFIRNVRLERAVQLILEQNCSIAEIAEKVGFTSSSYFSKCFHEIYGCKPSEYIEKIKKST